MAEVNAAQPEPDALPKGNDKIGRFLTVGVLSRFMRITYGTEAVPETQRRIAAYNRTSRFELAEIWQRVLVQLTGYDPNGETRLIVKAKRSFRVRR